MVEVEPTPLHKAIFNGRPIKHLISAGANIYATTSKGYSMLSLALVQKREEQASLLMDIYKQDMLALQQYFFKQNIRNFFWIREQVLVAFGIDDINFVQETVDKNNLSVSEPLSFIETNKKGLIILLKTSGDAVPGIVWITHKNPGDDREIAKITSRLYPNGVLAALRKDHKGRTLMEVAADQQMDTIFFQLDAIFGQHYLTQTEYLRLLCKISQNCDREVICFKNLLLRLNRFHIRDSFNNNNGHYKSLNYPLSLKQYEIFEYILDEMAVVRLANLSDPSVSQEDCKRYILNDFLVHSARIYQILYVQPPDLSGLADICMRYKVNLLAVHEPSKETALHAFVYGPIENLAVGDYIVDNFDVIVEKGYLKEIIHRLITKNWLNVLKQLYERHPIAKEELLRNNYAGMEVIQRSFQNEGNEMINFLVNAHKDQFTEYDINMLINACAHTSKKIEIMKILLGLPRADATKPTYGYTFTTPLFTALDCRKLDSFKLLYKSVENNSEGIKGKTDHQHH